MAKESKRENERLAFDRYTFELWFSPLDDVLFCIRRGLQLVAQLMGGYTHEFGGRTSSTLLPGQGIVSSTFGCNRFISALRQSCPNLTLYMLKEKC